MKISRNTGVGSPGTDVTKRMSYSKKISGIQRITKPEDSLFLAVLSWLHILLLCAGLYLLATLAYDMDMSTELPIYVRKSPAELLVDSLWLIVPLALSWILIRATRSLILYLLCSCAVCAILAGLSHSALTTVLTALLFAVRCYARIKKGKLARILAETPGEAGAQLAPELWEIPTFLDRPIPAHWGVFACYYVIFLITGKQNLLNDIFYLLFADVFICFLFGYLDNMQRFIRENKKIANLPVHSIQKVGRILLLVSTILLGLIVLPSALYGREPLANLHIHRKPVDITPSTEIEEMMPDVFFSADSGMPEEPPSDPPAWLIALGNILFYLGAVVTAILLIVIIYRICRNALSYFAQDEDDEIIFLGVEETSIVRAGRHSPNTKKERRNSPNQKIRRLYKKTIRAAMKQSSAGRKATSGQKIQTGTTTLAGWETPSELETKARLVRDASTGKLHTLYEKARYSQDGCTEAEAEALR